MDENKVIEKYLEPVLGDLMNKSLNAILELKNEGLLNDKNNKEFYQNFIKDATEFYSLNNNIEKLDILQDLTEYFNGL